jgi:hypothetical protein
MPTGIAPPYWSGWDIAKAIVLDLDYNGGSGYTLDGYGGLHQWGSAPQVNPQPDYWGWDIARGVIITTNSPCCSGYTLDGFGEFHGFGPNNPALQPHVTYQVDVARGITLNQQYFWHVGPPYITNGYRVDLYDGMTPYLSTNCC